MHRRQGNGSVKLGSAEAEALPPGRRTSPSPAVGEELSHGQDPRRDGGVVGDLLAQATQRTIGSSRRSPRVIYQGGSGPGRANQGACDAQHRTACRCEARCNVRTSLGGGHLASLGPQAASAPWASDEIASQCLATNFVAWSLTGAKSPPTRVRHRARSGSPLQLAGDPRYRLMLPAKRTNAQSAFAVLQADNLNTAAIRSGPSCSSWIDFRQADVSQRFR